MNGMHNVGHHLQIQAHNKDKAMYDREAFARSAYNRYYYACYLHLQSELGEMNPGWKCRYHRNYPEFIKGKIKEHFSKEKRRIGSHDRKLSRDTRSAIQSLYEAAEILERANKTRVVADYRPETRVEFKGTDRFSLNSLNITDAHGWYINIQTLMKDVRRAWGQINVRH